MDKKILTILLIIVLISPFFSGCTSNEEIVIDHPERIQIDKEFNIKINQLSKNKEYTLNITTKDDYGNIWSNQKEFTPRNSSYKLSKDQTMTMIQMMEPIHNDTKRPCYIPAEFGGKWNLTLTLKHNNKTLKTTNVTWTYGDPNVKHKTVKNEEIVGEIFIPPGNKTHPGVIVLHGGEGRPHDSLAYMLASNGFVAFAIQYFGFWKGEPVDQIPVSIDNIPIEYVKESGEYLLNHERVEGDQVGIIGGSKGGELALLSSTYFDIFGATISISGSGIIFGNEGDVAWTYRGEPIPYIPFVNSTYQSLQVASEGTIKNATIPIENISGPILAISGEDDGFLNSAKLTGIAMNRLQNHNFNYDHEFIVYENAGHVIGFPYIPTANRNVSIASGHQRYVGGTQKGIAKAEADHWPKILQTLNKTNN